MLDVRRLRVLREVSQRGSFSAAADALDYTQSAISQQIAALEREAGARLVERSSRGVRMTDAGRALVAHADVILARLADAEEELKDIAGLRGGRLRLTTFASAGATIVPKAIRLFRERHPGVELVLAPEEPQDTLGVLRSGEADVSLRISTTFDAPSPDQDVELTHLFDDPMHVLLPADHPQAGKAKVRLADLAEEDWILGSSGRCPDARILIHACQQAGFEPRTGLVSDDYLAIQGFVAAGFGVSMIPDLALIAVRDDVVVTQMTGHAPVRRIQAATLAGAWQSPAKAAFLEVLKEVSATFSVHREPLALAS